MPATKYYPPYPPAALANARIARLLQECHYWLAKDQCAYMSIVLGRPVRAFDLTADEREIVTRELLALKASNDATCQPCPNRSSLSPLRYATTTATSPV